MVERLGIGKWEMTTPCRVFNVDGSENKQGILTHYCLLRVKKGKEEDLQRFYITGLGGDRTILGYPWLHRFDPTIDWKQGRVLGAPIIIETLLLKWAREKEINRIVCKAHACTDWEEGDTIITQISPLPTHAAQQWAIAANKNKAKTSELPQRYSRHAPIFSEKGAERFPPSRPNDMVVWLKPGAPNTLNYKVYPLMRAELEEWHNFMARNKAMGWIRDSESPWSCPVFFIHKKDGSFRLIQDYCNVNKWTEQDVYPMPRIDLILEQLHSKMIFTALDIRDRYNNIRIKPEDCWKLAFKGPDGHYEPECMFFGMSNTLAVFQQCMDWIFTPLKARYPGCIFVHMDDVLITTGDDEDLHEWIVHNVLDMLAREDFYLKLSKCSFHQHDIDYLGIRIEGGQLRIDPTKINGLAEWREELKDVHEVRSTLGAFEYNRPFIKGYAKIVHPLTKLTKKDEPFVWTSECTEAIQKLKRIVSSDLVLKRPNHNKPFTLECDASQYALGAVLSQCNDKGKLQPVGYYSKTLIPAERNYDIYDQELLALVRGLENWRHLLLGAKHQIEVFTDHDGLTKYRHTQKISRRVARYLPVLWKYHIIIKHRAGTANKVADALSRPPGTDEGSQDNQNVIVLPDHLFCHAITIDAFEQQIRSTQEAHGMWIYEQAEQHQLEEGDGIWHKEGRVVVPPDNDLRRDILRNAHDHCAAGHPGIKKTLLAVICNYWWPKIGEFVTGYVKGCGICQETKCHDSTSYPIFYLFVSPSLPSLLSLLSFVPLPSPVMAVMLS